MDKFSPMLMGLIHENVICSNLITKPGSTRIIANRCNIDSCSFHVSILYMFAILGVWSWWHLQVCTSKAMLGGGTCQSDVSMEKDFCNFGSVGFKAILSIATPSDMDWRHVYFRSNENTGRFFFLEWNLLDLNAKTFGAACFIATREICRKFFP